MDKRPQFRPETHGMTIIRQWHVPYKGGKNKGKNFTMCEVQCHCGVVFNRKLWSKGKSCGCYQSKATSERTKGKPSGRRLKTAEQGRMSAARHIWRRSYSDGLSFEDFLYLSQHNCRYCGSPPSNSWHLGIRKNGERRTAGKLSRGEYNGSYFGEAARFFYNGLDRIDNSKDHSLDNIVVCCGPCNWMKSDMSSSEFITHVLKIVNKMGLK